jgi:hypothetical protein
MKTIRNALACASLLALAGAAPGVLAQAKGGGAAATYWMTAETSSGMAAAMGGGGDAAAMMSAMRGGGSYARNLNLQLGSGRRPTGAPTAEHLPPAGLQAGPSLPLVTPQVARATPASGGLPANMQRPKGRMLIYWGCGERARPGQPLVIDFATMAAGKMPAAFANMPKAMTPPSPATHATYGEWPNDRSRTRVPARGSLVGEHVVRGNYSPEIRFALGAGQDFLAPVTLTSKAAAASGSVPLVWRPVPGARAWFGATMGATESGDFVMWSSSETQAAAMAFDHVAEGDLARLIQNRTLMPASADRCTIPAEVAKAAPQSMLTLIAFGGESNIAQPRPAGAAASWRPEWNVKLRSKSTHMAMLGMDMPDMDEDSDEAAEASQPAETKKAKLRRGLKGLLGQ